MYIVKTRYSFNNNKIDKSYFEVVNIDLYFINYYYIDNTGKYSIIRSIEKLGNNEDIKVGLDNMYTFLYTYTLLDEEPTTEELNTIYKEHFNKIIEKLRDNIKKLTEREVTCQ